MLDVIRLPVLHEPAKKKTVSSIKADFKIGINDAKVLSKVTAIFAQN